MDEQTPQPQQSPPKKDFDIVLAPMEAVVTYWLSLARLLGSSRKVTKQVGEEAQYTSEPFVHHLLEVAFTDASEQLVRRMGQAKRGVLLDGLGRRLDLMRMALLDITAAENPRKTLAKMTAQFTFPPLNEAKAFRFAQDLVAIAEKDPGERPEYFNVDHRLKVDQLMVVLLFYVIWSRREGKRQLASFTSNISSPFYRDGLALVVDGFDGPFIRRRLRTHRETILTDVGHKMDASLEMALAIRNRLDYDRVFEVGKSFMA
jgi:hypothetical protein